LNEQLLLKFEVVLDRILNGVFVNEHPGVLPLHNMVQTNVSRRDAPPHLCSCNTRAAGAVSGPEGAEQSACIDAPHLRVLAQQLPLALVLALRGHPHQRVLAHVHAGALGQPLPEFLDRGHLCFVVVVADGPDLTGWLLPGVLVMSFIF